MHFISENNLAALIGTSNATVQRWGESGIYPSHQENGLKGFFLEELENILSVELEVRSAAAGDVPSDRFIVTTSATSSSDPALGWIMNAEGNKVEAVTETAWWIVEPETDIVKAGIGICNIRNDYFGTTLNYALTRKAISILNNTSNN